MTLFSPYGITVRGNNSSEYFIIGLSTITSFLRFDNVKFDINFRFASKSIASTISSLGNTFNVFKAPKLVLKARVDRNDPLCCPNYTQVLDYIANQLLPTSIFNSSQSCKFYIIFRTGSETATDFVASLLQLPAIVCKSNIMIELSLLEIDPQLQHPIFRRLTMPIEVISKWLHHLEGTGKERVLYIHLGLTYIENPREIFNHLKEVIFYANFYSSFHFFRFIFFSVHFFVSFFHFLRFIFLFFIY